MSKKTQTFCDRCGKPFDFTLSKLAGYFTHGIRKENHMKFHNMYYGNQNGYSYSDKIYDLCADCTQKLLEFLEVKTDGKSFNSTR